MKAMFTCLEEIEIKVAIMETEKEFLKKADAKLFSWATRKGAKSARTGDSFTEIIPLRYLGFALHFEKGIVP